MKKLDEMREEYRREDLGKGVRRKHYAEYQKGSNLNGNIIGLWHQAFRLHNNRLSSQDKGEVWLRT